MKTISGEDGFINLSDGSTSRCNALVDIRIDDNNGFSFTEDFTTATPNWPTYVPEAFYEFQIDWDGSVTPPLITVSINGSVVVGPFATQGGTICDDPADNQPPICLLYTSPSPRDQRGSRMPSSA